MEKIKKCILMMILCICSILSSMSPVSISAEENEMLIPFERYRDFSKSVTLTDYEKLVLDDYESGNRMKDEYVQARKKKAEELNLQDYVDEDYFFTKEFFDEFGSGNSLPLQIGAAILLDQRVHEDETAIMPLSLDAPVVTSYSISSLQVILGYYAYEIHWKVDGMTAFCMDSGKLNPVKGDVLQPAKAITNLNARKAMYYGIGGPKDMLSSRFTKAEASVITNALLSYALKRNQVANSVYPDFVKICVDAGKFIFDQPAPPDEFKTWSADSTKKGVNEAGNMDSYQSLAFWKVVPKGTLQIKKESANPEMSNDNSCYSIEGAEYTVYTTKNGNVLSGKAGVLTIGASGYSNTLTLEPGTYYIKETKAPLGYCIDTTIYTVTVKSSEKTSVVYKDVPASDPIGVLLRKVNSDNNSSDNQGLENAEFTVKYYKGDYADGVDPAVRNAVPARSWIIKTNANGFASLSDDFKVSGDDFYYSPTGSTSLPKGTITIQETKAPAGYRINSEIFVRKIVPDLTTGVNTYNAPLIPESPISFEIYKMQSGIKTPVADVTFTHTKPDGTKEDVRTNSNGSIILSKVETGIHTVMEKDTIAGLGLNQNEFKFEILADGSIRAVTGNLTEKGFEFYVKSDGNGVLTVYDDVKDFMIKINKKNEKGLSLDGAEFTLYYDAACTKAVAKMTTQNGNLTFPDLNDRTHYYLKETKAPAGYRIPVDANGKAHVYDIYTESTPSEKKFDFYVDKIKYTVNETSGNIHLEGTQDSRIVTITIVNHTAIQLPDTGSSLMIPLLMAGSLLMGSAIFMKRRKEKNKVKHYEKNIKNFINFYTSCRNDDDSHPCKCVKRICTGVWNRSFCC